MIAKSHNPLSGTINYQDGIIITTFLNSIMIIVINLKIYSH